MKWAQTQAQTNQTITLANVMENLQSLNGRDNLSQTGDDYIDVVMNQRTQTATR